MLKKLINYFSLQTLRGKIVFWFLSGISFIFLIIVFMLISILHDREQSYIEVFATSKLLRHAKTSYNNMNVFNTYKLSCNNHPNVKDSFYCKIKKISVFKHIDGHCDISSVMGSTDYDLKDGVRLVRESQYSRGDEINLLSGDAFISNSDGDTDTLEVISFTIKREPRDTSVFRVREYNRFINRSPSSNYVLNEGDYGTFAVNLKDCKSTSINH